MTTIRLLPLESADGPVNMAADEVLLEAAAGGAASLRFYTWSEPTVSLGYFQSATERLPGLPWVRRSTGGAALVHDRELTYALALPAGLPWQRRGESWICRMHKIISTALASDGVTAEGLVCGAESKHGPVLCFLHHTPGDLIVSGHKVAGSAQRKQRGALLQHGGILLRQSPHTPALPGLQELTGAVIREEALAAAIQQALAKDTGWELVLSGWNQAERQRIADLAESKYRSAAWNDKR